MNDNDLNEDLLELFDNALAAAIGCIEKDEIELPEGLEDLIRVTTFEDAGLLTREPGIVLRFKGGAEYQLSLVRSK